MSDLAFLKEDSILSIVDKMIEGRRRKKRKYLGMSEIGDECSRRLWLQYHQKKSPVFEGRILRLFRAGDIIENRIIMDLKMAGFKISGRQDGFRDFDGKLRGHCDGIIEGLPESSRPHILEIKSANDKSFKDFQKNGYAGHSSSGEQYHSQVQIYMHYAKLDRALAIVENKNTSERYMERIRYDKEVALSLVDKADNILNASIPPAGISSRPDFWKCKFCHLNNDNDCRNVWAGEVGF